MSAPDIAVLESDWSRRVALRAQLMEEGFEVVAADTWPMMIDHLQAAVKPRAAILDLHGLDHPREILREVRALLMPAHVLVLSALGALNRSEIEALGFPVLVRPVSIDRIIAATRRAIAA